MRPLALADLTYLVDIDHSYHTDYVWQMEINAVEREINLHFRQVRLPRSMRVDYPRDPAVLMEDWNSRAGILVAESEDEPVGYISLENGVTPGLVSATDMAVLRRLRRHGVGQSLIRAALTWAKEKGADRVILEMQSKNYPAIQMANKLAFEFCGYSDRYYANQDIALFFAKRI